MTVWGLAARQLHDRYWLSRGVQVVRPGAGPDPRGPGAFLLLRSDQAVLCGARPLLKRLTWLGCPTLCVRLVDRSEAMYRERVVSSPDGVFARIERTYADRQGNTDRIGVTMDPRAAALWASMEPGFETWALMRRRGGWARGAVWKTDGRLFDLASPRRQSDMLASLVEEWREPARVIPDIYQWKTGVWVHESARLDPAARVVGPAWVGAGARVSAGQELIGPVILRDARPTPEADIDWEALRLPSFPLLPQVRSKLSRRVSKRAFDVLMSVAVLLLTLPLYPLIMLAIYLEDGRPFFFGHRRQTLGGREFPCWKFRTMIKDAERLKAQLALQNQADGPQFFIERDPRLLRCGHWLRRFQFDELPQFWNVLLGHMSVVGPRPSPDKENQFCPAWREARLSVRPGITGLWQVRRTRLPETDFQEWIRYDLEYVQHQSWRLDLWIILQTVRKIFAG
ncbi:MAG: sugar transferase [Planctomycetota bacterium]|nr:sugar transferase [Planctomycetota bacterium]